MGQQLVHVVNAGLGPDGKQRCRRCGEALPPNVPGVEYPEGRVLVRYDRGLLHVITDPRDAAPDCIALDGTPAHA